MDKSLQRPESNLIANPLLNYGENGNNGSNEDNESDAIPRIKRMFRRSKKPGQKPSRLVIIRSAAKLGRKLSRKQSQNNNQPDAEGGVPPHINQKRNSVDNTSSFSNNGFQNDDLV